MLSQEALVGVKMHATPAAARGERVGTFALHSPAPFCGLVALCFLGVLMIVGSR